jgi:DNA adenine methylase
MACAATTAWYFNVPYGNYKKPYFPEAEIKAFAEKARRATFVCSSYVHARDGG